VSCCAVFTNRLDDIRMQDLAETDVSEAVLSVQVALKSAEAVHVSFAGVGGQ